MQAHLAELLKFRAKFLKEENPYLFGNTGFQSSIVGYKVVSKYAATCGDKNPNALTCTKLRKHLATPTQVFNMNDNEIDQLARFLDHTVGITRLRDYKIAKLLILMEKRDAGEHRGKSLDEIRLNLGENLLLKDAMSEHSEDENDTAALVSKRTLIDEVDQSEERKQKKAKQIVHKKREVLIACTEEQKQAVTSYFKTYH
ncbi:hypothetical protein HHI36_001165 [Cryptolaemus montrouzieri]|uniref:Uncharacterized protein n=1 Tax=Cryptolaemus montrouzieri TaxID=559131 RepID=A0ABD2P7H5_9CUCU